MKEPSTVRRRLANIAVVLATLGVTAFIGSFFYLSPKSATTSRAGPERGLEFLRIARFVYHVKHRTNPRKLQDVFGLTITAPDEQPQIVLTEELLDTLAPGTDFVVTSAYHNMPQGIPLERVVTAYASSPGHPEEPSVLFGSGEIRRVAMPTLKVFLDAQGEETSPED